MLKNIPPTKIVNVMHTADLKLNERPGLVHWYNSTMGSVDRFDQQIHNYSICTKYANNRWPIRVIDLFRDLEFQNIFLLWKIHAAETFKYNERTKFYYKLAHEFLTPEALIGNRKRKIELVTTNLEPLVKVGGSRHRCNACSKAGIQSRTSYGCSSCKLWTCRAKHSVRICVDCFDKKLQ